MHSGDSQRHALYLLHSDEDMRQDMRHSQWQLPPPSSAHVSWLTVILEGGKGASLWLVIITKIILLSMQIALASACHMNNLDAVLRGALFLPTLQQRLRGSALPKATLCAHGRGEIALWEGRSG